MTIVVRVCFCATRVCFCTQMERNEATLTLSPKVATAIQGYNQCQTHTHTCHLYLVYDTHTQSLSPHKGVRAHSLAYVHTQT